MTISFNKAVILTIATPFALIAFGVTIKLVADGLGVGVSSEDAWTISVRYMVGFASGYWCARSAAA